MAYAVGLLALLATNAIYMAIPRVFGAAVDALRAGASRSELTRLATIIAVAALAQSVVRILSRIFVLGASRRVEYDLKGLLHERLVRLSPSFYDALSTGDLMSRMTNDVTLVRALGGPGVLYFANALLIYVLGVGFMVSLSWQLTLVVLAPLPLMAWVVRSMVHKVRAYALGSRRALSDLNSVVQENLSGASVVRAFAIEEPQVRRFEARSDAYVDWALKESWTRAQMIPLIGLGGGLSYIGVLLVGAPLATRGIVSLGDLVAFLSYVTMMVFPTVAFGWILSLVQRGAAAMERLDGILRAPTTIASAADAVEPSVLAGRVEVRDLTFRYDDAIAAYTAVMDDDSEGHAESRRPALVGVDFEASPGQLIALVGRVGSGKSTLLKALARFLELPAGTVFVDGVDVLQMRLESLRDAIAYVPQDDFLFSASVRDNVAYGVPDAPLHAIEGAASAAGLRPGTSGLARGLDTQAGERGLNLSGGQRQRTALARALLRDAPILLLDNALSNVDTETEHEILGALASARGERTVIAASNRITAVQDADRIYVFDAGRVIDSGRHSELIARPGLYASMYEQQQLSARLEAYG